MKHLKLDITLTDDQYDWLAAMCCLRGYGHDFSRYASDAIFSAIQVDIDGIIPPRNRVYDKAMTAIGYGCLVTTEFGKSKGGE